MYKKIFLVLIALGLTGCGISEKVYTPGKIIYKGARVAYVELDIDNENLEKIDKVVVSYDKVRTEITEAIKDSKKKQGVVTSEAQVK